MSKFRGLLGFNRGFVETDDPGVLSAEVEEKEVSGEMRTIGARWQNHGMGNSVSARHVLSIVTPEDTIVEFTEVVYILWQGRKWSVTGIEYKRPRVELTLGGLYNG